MKRFIKNIFIFGLILLAIAFCVDYYISYYLRYKFKSWGDIYNQQLSSDIIINGSSRAWVQYDPIVLDTILNISSFNLGIDGSGINRQILKYDIYCKQQNILPKLIIQNLDLCTMVQSVGYEREQFFPMFIFDRESMKQFSRYEAFDLYEKYLPCYRYIGYPRLVQSSFGLNQLDYDDSLVKGYHGQNRTWDGSVYYKIKEIDYSQDPDALNMFDAFLNDVTEKGTKVIFVYAPIYIGVTRKIKDLEGMYEMYDTLAIKYGIPILDYNYDPLCYDTAYFYNATHMNKKGSELFSVKLAHDIDSLGILN